MSTPSSAARILIESLREPLHAIVYTASTRLRELHPARFILEGEDGQFDVEEYAKAGRCTVTPHAGIPPLTSAAWYGEPWGLWKNTEIQWLDVRCRDRSYEVVELAWRTESCNHSHLWLIADDQAAAEAFWSEVSAWNRELRDEVLVFDHGYWQKDASLFKAIRDTTFDALVLPEGLKEAIRSDLERFLASREAYERYKVPWKRGVVLTGPPGNGKTHCVKALVNHLRIACLYVRSFRTEHGTDERNIHSVFDRARKTTPCLLVLEDLDALITDQNRSFFLNELDGFAANHGIITVATTNHPERLDPAIRERPSRFDLTWHFDLPAAPERTRYLARWTETLEPALRPTASGIAAAVGSTDGFSFAYLKELFVSALMRWINEPRGDGTMDRVLVEQASLLRAQLAAVRAEGRAEAAGGG